MDAYKYVMLPTVPNVTDTLTIFYRPEYAEQNIIDYFIAFSLFKVFSQSVFHLVFAI